jgi:peroxiredoxin Q/BCP
MIKFSQYKIFIYLLGCLLIPSITHAEDLKVGDIAPNFTLKATNGKTYSLQQYRGKKAIVLAWYPMANTRQCTIECKSLVEEGHLIRAFNVSYMMASVDNLDKNQSFAKKTKVDFPMLSDPTKQTAKDYGVLNLFGVAKRVTFYIGKEGRILYIDRKINAKHAAKEMSDHLARLNVEKTK